MAVSGTQLDGLYAVATHLLEIFIKHVAELRWHAEILCIKRYSFRSIRASKRIFFDFVPPARKIRSVCGHRRRAVSCSIFSGHMGNDDWE